MDWAQSEVLSRATSRVTDAWGVGDDIEKLRLSLLNINILADQSEWWRFRNDNVDKLLAQLRDAKYDAEDVIDDFVYQELKMKVEGGESSSRARRIFTRASSFVGEVLSGKPSTVKDVQDRLDLVANCLKQAIELLDSKKPEIVGNTYARRETSSVVLEPDVIGRDSEKEVLIKILVQIGDSAVASGSGNVKDVTLVRNKRRKMRNVSVLPIVGMGGLGKTTLAQMVYNDKRVQDHFPLKIWVYVSEQFDVKHLTKEIVKSATGMQENSFPTLDSIYVALKEEVLSKKFLLVLDDVWNEDPLEWDEFYKRFYHGFEGSMILLTTRSKVVAEISGTLDPIFIKELLEEPYANLFNKCAFGQEDPKDYPELGTIAEKIRAKLMGSPLAAKTLGGLLRRKLDARHWRDILNSEFWQLKQGDGGILPALRLSYLNLPPEIKRCFSFCCMFPKGFWFRKELLASMWVAHGFVKSEGDELLEQRGAMYFEDLLSRSLFYTYGPGLETFMIHDLMHDLAQSVSKDECFYIQTSESELRAPESVRHLSVAKDLVEVIRSDKYNKLRSLACFTAYRPFHGLNSSCSFLLSEFFYLRMFNLNNCGVKELPVSFGNLKHLRYLDLSGNKIEELPESIGQLYNLQFLDLTRNTLKKFPKGFTKLISLRKLRINHRTLPMISGIGKLTSLQDLNEYQVQRKDGHRIGELQHMTQLLRKLHLYDLENIEDKDEAAQAMLSNKRYIDILILAWTENRNINHGLDEEVFDSLQPHQNLRVFYIYYFGGLKLPSWLHVGVLSHLSDLRIVGCVNLNVVRNLPSSLSELTIERCHSLISIEECLLPDQLPDIKKIFLVDCKELKSVPVENFNGFVFLQELEVSNCPKLTCSRELVLPSSIQKLVMKLCGNLDMSLPNCLRNLTNLTTLRIEKCPHITSLAGEEFNHLNALQVLSIRECEELSIIGSLPNPLLLKELCIVICPKLTQVDLLIHNSGQGGSSRSHLEFMVISDTSLLKFPSLRSALSSLQTLEIEGSIEVSLFSGYHQAMLQNLNSLKKLSFSNCDNLEGLPPWLHGLTSLNYLKVINCPKVRSLPDNGLPTSLTDYRCGSCDPGFTEQFKRHMKTCHQEVHRGSTSLYVFWLTELTFSSLFGVVREKDACWEYCEKLEGNKVRCKFCLKILNGGISRLKYHLSRIPAKGVHPCGKVRDDVTEKVNAILAMKDETKAASSVKKQRLAEARTLIATLPPAKLPFISPLSSSRILSLPQQRAPLDAERCIAEFFFENNLDFTMTSSSSYQLMLEAVGGPGFKGPSREDLKTVWLPKFKEEMNAWIEEIREDWGTTGCTILADTWTDNKTRALISFSISSPLGTFFHKSVDASTYFINKNSKCLYELFDSVIQDFGPENVVQIITDNVFNYGNVGGQIMQNYSTIFWSPCAARCVNSILDEFSKIDWVNRCIVQAQCITKFIYNHEMTLEMMKKFTGGQELVRTGITKPVSDFLTLQSMLNHRPRLKHMFTSPEYTTSPYAGRAHSITCIDTLDDTELWRSVEEIAAVSEPLLKILRDVSGGKPGIGSIYESMTKAKDSIRTYYIMDEGKCKTFLDIIDAKWRHELHSSLHAAAAYLNPSIQYNQEVKFLGMVKEELHVVLDKVLRMPELMKDITSQIYTFRKAQGMFGSNLAKEARNSTSPWMWWEQYGDSAPGLQRAAVRILSQVCSTWSLDRNWNTIQQIHSDKRNRLDKETLTDLLYVHSNLKLRSKGKASESDPIEKEDIDMTSDWVEETENIAPTQWLDRFSTTIFSSNDHIFGL